MRKVIHAVVCLIAVIPWAMAMTMMTLVMWLVLLADRIWPEADKLRELLK